MSTGGGNRRPSEDYELQGGRNAFKMSSDAWCDADEATQASELLRQQHAMRSFTDSIDEMDLPPAPELPPSLDIDRYPCSIRESSTNDTIVEVIRPKKSDYDKTLGETQKYPLTVPGPGHADQEQELHQSLLKLSDSIDSELELIAANQAAAASGAERSRHEMDADHAALRREYSNTIKQRPRPTTPTSGCALESYVEHTHSSNKLPPDSGAKMRVTLPGQGSHGSLRRKSSMSWNDFHDSMSRPRSSSVVSGRSTPLNDYDGDILDEDPALSKIAPRHPVVHRRTSVDWENFEDEKERQAMETTSSPAVPTTSEEAADPAASNTAKRASIPSSTPPPSPSTDGHQQTETAMDIGQAVRKASQQLSEKAAEDRSNEQQEVEPSQDPHTTEVQPQEEPHQVEVPQHEENQMDYSHLSGYDSSQYYGGNADYSTYGQQAAEGDQSTAYYGQYGYGTDQNQAYGYGYDASTGYGYDQNYQQQQQPQQYDGAGYGGYGTYDYNYPQQQADGEYAGYAQTTVEGGDQAAAYYGQQYAGYDQQQPAEGTDYSGYAQQPEAAEYAGYSQQPAESNGQTAAAEYGSADYSGYDEQAEGADYSAYAEHPAAAQSEATEGGSAGYGAQTTEEGGQNADYSAYALPASGEQSTEYAGYDQTHAADVPGDYSAYASNYGGQEATSDYSNYGEQPQETNYSSYAANQQTNNFAYSAYGQPATMEPLFKPPPKEHDPYAWEAQDVHPGEQQPSEEAQEELPAAEHPHRPPPPRPAPPPAKAPERPPAPTVSHQPPPRPPPAHLPPPKQQEKKKLPEPEPEEEDAWTKFKKMTENVSSVVRSSEETLKTMEETTVAKDIKDESYIAQIGGHQAYDPVRAKLIKESQEKEKRAKKERKDAKKGKKAKSPDFDPSKEESLDKQAAELAKKMAAMHSDLADWKPPSERQAEAAAIKESSPETEETPMTRQEVLRKESRIENQQSTSLDIPMSKEEKTEDAYQPIGDVADENITPSNWAGFDDRAAPELPPSESGFFSRMIETAKEDVADAFGGVPPSADPFAPAADTFLLDQAYDPFEVRPVDDIVAEVKARAAAEAAAMEAQEDLEFFGAPTHSHNGHSNLSTPTPEGGSPVSARPTGFDDDFKEDAEDLHTPTPLFDEDDKEPLEEFPQKFSGDGWELMIRHPVKKKIMSDRFWKPCYARIQGTSLLLFNSKTEPKPFHELMLQACYSLSDISLQAYDVYGKIHTVKLQHVLYKERVGIRPGQISRLMEGHVTKYGMPLEHSAQCTVLLKFGCLNAAELASFVATAEDVLFRCPARRETTPTYKQDEIQVHCYDEYSGYVDKNNVITDQKARVRLFCLAFVTGSPYLEIGLNDLRRQGKEIVRRKDILPMYTERWIRFENLEFHNTVETPYFDKEHVVRLQPPDGCFFEVMRFRVRPPKNREKPLNVKCLMKIAGSKIEIRLEAMAAAQTERRKGASESIRQIPCEDIQIRFPIPEAWIYLFREERHWGVGSVHAKVRRPGKVKNLKDRLMGAMQTTESSLIEVAIGEAKYEHVYRALVWRIPRLPEKHHAAYKRHLLLCRFELSSFDLMPETFLPTCDVEFTMPLATISNTVVRSVGVEQHEDSDRVEKFVRYVAKCQYKFEIDYVQCAELDADPISEMSVTNPGDATMGDSTMSVTHQPAFQPEQVNENHEGYRIDFSKEEVGGARQADSSSDDEEDTKHKMPIIQIDMKGYGY